MPLYDYACEACGPFRDWRPMSRSEEDAPCPACGAASRRTVAMPFLPCVSRNDRIAHERNERSADAPRVVRGEEWRAMNGAIGRARPARRRTEHGRNMYRPSILGHVH